MVGKVATAFFLALGLIQTAFAADGHVHVNGVQLNKPSGCINVEAVQFAISQFPQVSIENESNKIAHVFEESNCNGKFKAIVPSQSHVSHFGRSFYIE
ncbi:unnamed protein product [Cunninghamella blakesleeana]